VLLSQTLWRVGTTLASLFLPVKGLAIANELARKIAFFDEKIVIFSMPPWVEGSNTPKYRR